MEHLRPYDKVFRYGGEEFIICMQNTGLEVAVAVITRLCEGLASTPIYHNELLINVTASFGVVSLDPEVSVEQSVDRADKAMYAAKTAGRNCVRVAETQAQV
jgi:diguanylate cyclase (GGDEF)-like protein